MVPRLEISLIFLVAGRTEQTQRSVSLDLSMRLSRLWTRDWRGVGEVGILCSGLIKRDAFTGYRVKLMLPRIDKH